MKNFLKMSIGDWICRHHSIQQVQKTMVLAGYPGVGKSVYFKENKGTLVSDSDSSLFSWVETPEGKVRNPDFPNNYIEHIKRCIDNNYSIVFVSTHKDVLKALYENSIAFTVVYPARNLKEEYLKRYRERGSDEGFINLMDRMWDQFHDDIDKLEKVPKIELLTPETTMVNAIQHLTVMR